MPAPQSLAPHCTPTAAQGWRAQIRKHTPVSGELRLMNISCWFAARGLCLCRLARPRRRAKRAACCGPLVFKFVVRFAVAELGYVECRESGRPW
eukprot:1225395-Rhodomonas_salina.1